MRKMFEYRIFPTKKQEGLLQETLNECRWLYNHLLEQRKAAYELESQRLSLYQQQAAFPVLKQERPSLATVHSQVLQQVAVRLDLAMKAFFRRVKAGETPGYPRFKGHDRYDSFTYPQSGFKIDEQGKLYASGIGHIKIVLHRPMRGKLKTLTLHKSSTGKWYACFSVECEPGRLPECASQVGIDVGLKTFATLSTGEEIANPRFFRTEEKALAHVQRKHSTLAKGTKESRKIVNRFGIIAVEDLTINRMIHNHCLAKSIADASWSAFFAQLSAKAEEAGRQLVKVNPAYTSQTCSTCGHRHPMPLSERIFACPCCHAHLDRDLNAAKNILGLGLQADVIPEAPPFRDGE